VNEIKATQWQFRADGILYRSITKHRDTGTQTSLSTIDLQEDTLENRITFSSKNGRTFFAFPFSLEGEKLKFTFPSGFMVPFGKDKTDAKPKEGAVTITLKLDRGLAEYDYPEAKDRLENTTDSHVHLTRMNTAEKIEKVRAWYEKKLGIDHDPDLGHGGTRAHAGQGTVSEVANNSTDQHNGIDKPRPVKVYVLLQDSPRHWLQVVLTRADTEKETHIVVTYVTR
jgi:hypothetical protein